MHRGQSVTFVGADGLSAEGTVSAVTGTGESTYKVLTISVNGQQVSDVPYALDRTEGIGYWTLDPVTPPAEPEVAAPVPPAVDPAYQF